jgi:radical SAM superfamily enzyme YgiQ (UPF0313 family)
MGDFMKTLLVAINSKFIHTNLGSRDLYTYAKAQGKDIELLEEAIQTPLLTVLAKITSAKAQLIGINVHIWNRDYVFALADLIRQVNPNIPIFLGGPEVGFTPETGFAKCSAVDYIIMGEGEEPLVSLISGLERGETIHDEHIAVRRDKSSWQGKPAVFCDMSKLLFPYEDLEKVVREHKILYYECTRGCPFNCSYCLSGITKNVRRRPLDMVKKDMLRFVKAKAPLVKFVDRTYNLGEDYFLPLWRFLASLATDTVFHFEIKADLLSEETLAFLDTVPKHRFQFEIGVQTTNPKVLSAIGRQDNWSWLSHNIAHLAQKSNIPVHLDLIAGLPYEDLASFINSFNMVYGLKPTVIQLGFLKVLPGAAITQQKEQFGMVYQQGPPYEILLTKYMGYEDLRFLKIVEDIFDHTYNSGKYARTLEYITDEVYKKDYFSFYGDVAKWWQKNHLEDKGHSEREAGLLLLKFVEESKPEIAEQFKEILRFDIFTLQPNWRPDCFTWHTEEMREKTLSFWRNAELVHKYFPAYEFTTWRRARKFMPMEVFKYAPNRPWGGTYYIMADYNNLGKYYEIKEM